MIAVVLILTWSVLLGLTARRFGPAQGALLAAGIVAAILIQYATHGPS
jgi:hypothetical protein